MDAGAARCSQPILAVGKLIVSLAAALYSLETTIELSEREHRASAHSRHASGDDAEKMLIQTGFC
jgi:hypothetical protein